VHGQHAMAGQQALELGPQAPEAPRLDLDDLVAAGDVDDAAAARGLDLVARPRVAALQGRVQRPLGEDSDAQ